MAKLNKFNLNQLLGGSVKAEEGKGTENSPEYNITHVSVYDLEPSEDNFYNTEQIQELKDSIAAFGIKQNLIVKPIEGNKYRVIAGHRRRLAIISLVEGGKTEFEKVPCIIETEVDELRERLLLITTNSTARQLTDWEKIKQAEELRSILEQVKKRDKVPGRLRDLIASVLDTSPAQVGRMEAISKNLTPVFQNELKEGRVNISTAYEISGMPNEQQQEVYEVYQEHGSVSIKDVKEKKLEGQADLAEYLDEEIEECESEESRENIKEKEDEPEREIRSVLHDGTQVVFNTGDRVIFQASRPGGMPLAIDPDSIVDDLIISLEQKDQRIAELQARSDQWEHAFANADKQYLKLEKDNAALRRDRGKG